MSSSRPVPERKFQPVRVDALMQKEFPKQKFIVDGLIPVGLCMIAGAPKLGKSWATLDLALSVAAGRPFLGRETTQGAVLYLGLEDQERRLQDRLRLMGPDMDWTDLPLDVATAIEAVDDGGFELIEEWLRGAENPRLVVVDVWGRFSSRESTAKNEYERLTHTLQPLQALAHTYGVTLMLVHHTRKTGGENSGGGDPFDQVLGSRALTSNMDVTMVLNRTRMQRDATLSMTGRDILEVELPVRFDQDTYRWMAVDEVAGPALSPARQQVLDAVTAGHRHGADIVKAVGKERTAVANHLSALVKDGLLVRAGGGRYELPNSTEVADPADMNDNPDVPSAPDFEDLV
jgi:DNA-binding transcriptional ArsR family regulator